MGPVRPRRQSSCSHQAVGFDSSARASSTGIGPSSGPTRWARYDELSVVARPRSGEIELSGYAGGDGIFAGAPWTFDPALGIDVGQRDATGHFDGSIEAPVPVE